ncbi:MAG: NAD(P)/FAD-dependent oxidoreductase [Chloroflexota bacterium]
MRIRMLEAVSGALAFAGGAALLSRWMRQSRLARREALAGQSDGQPRRRIVIVGVGFGGLSALNRLGELVADDPRTDVLLLDQQNYHLFTPLLYQVATGGVEPSMLTYPARAITRDQGFRYEEATVRRVDLDRKVLETDAGPFEFDSLILAPGSVPNFFGMADAEEHTLPLKWVNDSVRIHDQVINAFELADRERDLDRRRTLLTTVVIGGGATGVELAASLSDLIFTTLLPNYPGINSDDVRLELIEARGTLLPGWNDKMGAVAEQHLNGHHVQVRLDTTVSHVGPSEVELGGGERIPSATAIWTAGVRAEPVVGTLPGEKERDGRIRVDQNLELPGHPGVFVVGDAAAIVLPGAERPMPPTAWAAIGQGRAAAENAVRRLRDQSPRAFWMRSPGDLVSLGRGAAAADIFGMIFDGLAGWFLRRAVYLTNLVGFRNRLLVALEWAFVTFHHRTIASFTRVSPRLAAVAARPTPIRAHAPRGRAQPPTEAPSEEERRAG